VSVSLRSALVSCALLLACVSQPTHEARETGSATPERRPPRPEPSCAPLPEPVLALLEREGCPVVLRAAEASPASDADPSTAPLVMLELLAIANEGAAQPFELIARGPAPASCGAALQRCEFEGIVDPALGPLLLVRELGHESEHPVQVWLGIHEAARLGFVPSWQGEASVVDHTRVGPPFALAPHACAGELRLLPHARLPEAAGELPPAALMMLAGRWAVAEQGVVVPPQQPSPSSEGCTLLLALP
jgi:hypothetical protein